ncbi:hypothetical protein TNCV_1384131 [Trichonephila clavipes]|nr:hypothetical protein TNCV_1384131 [Trichonephila clavipes]
MPSDLYVFPNLRNAGLDRLKAMEASAADRRCRLAGSNPDDPPSIGVDARKSVESQIALVGLEWKLGECGVRLSVVLVT